VRKKVSYDVHKVHVHLSHNQPYFNFVVAVPDRWDCRPFAVSAIRSTRDLRSAFAAPTVDP